MIQRVILAFLSKRGEQLRLDLKNHEQEPQKQEFLNPFKFVPAVIRGDILTNAPGVQEWLMEIAFRDPIYLTRIANAGIMDFNHSQYKPMMSKWLNIAKYPKAKQLGYPIDVEYDYLKIANYLLMNPEKSGVFKKEGLVNDSVIDRLKQRAVFSEYKPLAALLKRFIAAGFFTLDQIQPSIEAKLESWVLDDNLDAIVSLANNGLLLRTSEKLKAQLLKRYSASYVESFLNKL